MNMQTNVVRPTDVSALNAGDLFWHFSPGGPEMNVVLKYVGQVEKLMYLPLAAPEEGVGWKAYELDELHGPIMIESECFFYIDEETLQGSSISHSAGHLFGVFVTAEGIWMNGSDRGWYDIERGSMVHAYPPQPWLSYSSARIVRGKRTIAEFNGQHWKLAPREVESAN
jgi:hypothetical protein